MDETEHSAAAPGDLQVAEQDTTLAPREVEGIVPTINSGNFPSSSTVFPFPARENQAERRISSVLSLGGLGLQGAGSGRDQCRRSGARISLPRSVWSGR